MHITYLGTRVYNTDLFCLTLYMYDPIERKMHSDIYLKNGFQEKKLQLTLIVNFFCILEKVRMFSSFKLFTKIVCVYMRYSE